MISFAIIPVAQERFIHNYTSYRHLLSHTQGGKTHFQRSQLIADSAKEPQVVDHWLRTIQYGSDALVTLALYLKC